MTPLKVPPNLLLEIIPPEKALRRNPLVCICRRIRPAGLLLAQFNLIIPRSLLQGRSLSLINIMKKGGHHGGKSIRA